jgi:hypothetical protein
LAGDRDKLAQVILDLGEPLFKLQIDTWVVRMAWKTPGNKNILIT